MLGVSDCQHERAEKATLTASVRIAGSAAERSSHLFELVTSEPPAVGAQEQRCAITLLALVVRLGQASSDSVTTTKNNNTRRAAERAPDLPFDIQRRVDEAKRRQTERQTEDISASACARRS